MPTHSARNKQRSKTAWQETSTSVQLQQNKQGMTTETEGLCTMVQVQGQITETQRKLTQLQTKYTWDNIVPAFSSTLVTWS